MCGKALGRESQGPEASAPGCRYLWGLTNPDAGHSSVHLPEVKLNPFYGFFSNWNPDLPKAGSQVSPPGAQMKGRCPGSARESGAQQEQLREGNLDGAQGGPLSIGAPVHLFTGSRPDGAYQNKQRNRAGEKPAGRGEGGDHSEPERCVRPAAAWLRSRAQRWTWETWVPAPKVESEKCDVNEGHFLEIRD